MSYFCCFAIGLVLGIAGVRLFLASGLSFERKEDDAAGVR